MRFYRPKNRYLTFTFDDGFINSAREIDRVLNPHKATFYIVTGWVKPNNLPIADEYNRDADHGSVDDWKALAVKGHEIGSHSLTHLPVGDPAADSAALSRQAEESLNFIRKIHTGPYTFAFPHNRPYPNGAPGFDAIRLGPGKQIYNRLEGLDLKKIYSWGPWPKSLPMWRILLKIWLIPAGSWLVLNLHGVGVEGWHPWQISDLNRLKSFVLKQGFKIKTVAEMVRLLRK